MGGTGRVEGKVEVQVRGTAVEQLVFVFVDSCM